MADSHFTYLWVDICAVIVPLIFSFHPRIQFFKKWKAAAMALILPMFLFIPWDIYFTNLGVWGFNPRYITGVYFLHLPIEEILFFICIPYSCLFTYHALSELLWNKHTFTKPVLFNYVLAVSLILVGLIFYERHYTFSAFFLSGICLLWCANYFREKMAPFFLTYLVLLVGFFAVNGVLTGTGLESPVVWYNNSENTGVRLLTIPLEDFFYGLLLILLNILFFEKFSPKKS